MFSQTMMDSDSIPELYHILLKNLHLFIPAFVLFAIEIGLSSYQTQYQQILTIGECHFSMQKTNLLLFMHQIQKNLPEYSTLILILMIFSIPLSVINPPIWFTLYMTTFIHMLHFKGKFSRVVQHFYVYFSEHYLFSIIATVIMFLSIFYHELRSISKKKTGSKSENLRITIKLKTS